MVKVFIPEIQQANMGLVEIKGEPVPLLPKNNKLGLEPDRIKFLITRALSVYSSGDYLLVDGRNVHCAVAASVLATQRNTIDMLIWSKSDNDYVTRSLFLSNIKSADNIISEPRAFLVNDTHSDIRIPYQSVPLTKGSDPNIMDPDKIKDNMLPILKHSGPSDYILNAGSRTHNIVASCIMTRMHGRVNFLLWNSKTACYKMRSIILSSSR